MSNTEPVENEFSSVESQVTSAASSWISRKRPRGIFDSMNWWNSGVIWTKMRVLAAAGVTTLKEEKQFNTFLRLNSPSLIARLRESFPDLPAQPDAKTVVRFP